MWCWGIILLILNYVNNNNNDAEKKMQLLLLYKFNNKKKVFIGITYLLTETVESKTLDAKRIQRRT